MKFINAHNIANAGSEAQRGRG